MRRSVSLLVGARRRSSPRGPAPATPAGRSLPTLLAVPLLPMLVPGICRDAPSSAPVLFSAAILLEGVSAFQVIRHVLPVGKTCMVADAQTDDEM